MKTPKPQNNKIIQDNTPNSEENVSPTQRQEQKTNKLNSAENKETTEKETVIQLYSYRKVGF